MYCPNLFCFPFLCSSFHVRCVQGILFCLRNTPGSIAQSVALTIVLSDSLLHQKIITLILMRIISIINTNGWGASMDACKRAMFEACVQIRKNLLGLRPAAPIAPRPPPPPLLPPPPRPRPPPGGLRPPPGGFAGLPLPFTAGLPFHFGAGGSSTGSLAARAPIALQPAARAPIAW